MKKVIFWLLLSLTIVSSIYSMGAPQGGGSSDSTVLLSLLPLLFILIILGIGIGIVILIRSFIKKGNIKKAVIFGLAITVIWFILLISSYSLRVSGLLFLPYIGIVTGTAAGVLGILSSNTNPNKNMSVFVLVCGIITLLMGNILAGIIFILVGRSILRNKNKEAIVLPTVNVNRQEGGAGEKTKSHEKFVSKNYKDILIENGLGEYIDTFTENKLTDISIIAELSDSELEKIGIATLGDRKKILKVFSSD